MLQIMEDGRLTDSQGRHVDFKNCIIVMTSNVGAANIVGKQKKLGFAESDREESDNYESIREAVMSDLRRTFKPEFLNRVDDIIVFHQLTKENIEKIAYGMLETVKRRVSDLGIAVDIDESAVKLLAEAGFDPTYGARPLRRAIQSKVEDNAAEKLLDGTLKAGDKAILKAENGEIVFDKEQLEMAVE